MKKQLINPSSTREGSILSRNSFEGRKIFWQVCFLTMILFVSLSQFACDKAFKGEVNIIDKRDTGEPEENLASHKPRDVEAFRIEFMDEQSYSIMYYQNEEGKLRAHKFWYGTEDDFDKVAYEWVNDTTVSVKLINSSTKKEKKFKLFGYGSSSGILQ